MSEKIFYENLDRLMKNGTNCDFTLIVDNKRLRVPKPILAAHSDYFAALFNGEWTESKNSELPINDIKYDVMVKLIGFLYTPKIEITSIEVALELFKAADKYQIPHVKLVAAKYIIENTTALSNDIVINVFIEAEQRNSKEIMMVTLRHMLKRDSELRDITKLKNFDKLNVLQLTIVLRAFSLYHHHRNNSGALFNFKLEDVLS